MLKYFFVFLIGVTSLFSQNYYVDKIAIQVKDANREFSFTNKRFGQYYGMTNSQFNDGWMGWTLFEQRLFNDYSFSLGKNILDRTKATTTVYPHKINRLYENGVEENFLFADTSNIILIELKNLNRLPLTFQLDGVRFDAAPTLDNNIISAKINSIINDYYFFITANKNISLSKNSENKISISFENLDSVQIAIVVDKDDKILKSIFNKWDRFFIDKKMRIEKVLRESEVATDNEKFNQAFLWAVASLDALITKQEMKGIFAGLPWFNNYWGRDTFISLPGATYTLGNFNDAREILLSFANAQDVDPSSKYFGRIPNRVTLNEKIYNTVDGTPWFIIQAYNFFNYSNDSDFIKIIYPNLKIALEAAIKNHVDSLGFLTHEDAETWMDAKGPSGAWSPRDNRANDIQALWFKQLKYTSELALMMGDIETSKNADSLSKLLKQNFVKYFVDAEKGLIYDRLKANNVPDKKIRPNLFFVLNTPELIPDFRMRLNILSNAMKNLVLPYGVLSLSQYDENFHPFHHNKQFYPQDAAYHNGIIWTWNTGPVVRALCGFGMAEKAWRLTEELTHQILERGAVGTISELTDALPRKGETDVRLSGTFTQAWSLAEYIRNIFQDYLGVIPDAPNNSLYLIPNLPNDLRSVSFRQKVGKDLVLVKYDFNNEFYQITLVGSLIKNYLDIGLGVLNKASTSFQLKTDIKAGDVLIIKVPTYSKNIDDLIVTRNGEVIKVNSEIYIDPVENKLLYEKIKFATPFLNPNLKSLKGPDYFLFTNDEIKKVNKKAKVIFDVKDKLKDEKYLYPTNPNFRDGILDLGSFKLSEDSQNYYFKIKMRNLHNPGWHNEYGFQLTLLTIAIKNNSDEKLSKEISVNSKFILDEKRKFNRLIVVGGGFEIKDFGGNILAAYFPAESDIKNPLGNIERDEISFAIPKSYLGEINKNSVITILAGAQDDHGGSGIGVFREVNVNASEWNGGGKKKLNEDNVYDLLFIN